MVDFSKLLEHLRTSDSFELTSDVFLCFSFLHLVLFILCQWKTSTHGSLHDVIMNLILEIRVQKVLQLELLLWLDELRCLRVLI